jgi:putative tricarboxylic transport membrane protein
MAVMLGAFSFHGIIPGPRFFQNNLDIVMVIILSLLVANILTSVVGLVFAKQLARVTRIDIHVLAPLVLVFAFFGSYALYNSMFDLVITLFFGVLGFIMLKVKMSRIPMILALVLAPIVEKNFFRSLQISGGDYVVFVRSPLAIFLILLVLVSLFLPYIQAAIGRWKVGIGE